jgi:hypothetical protein
MSTTETKAKAPRTCVRCGEEIERVGNTWVTVRSGDDGGTYDLCERNWIAAEERQGPHKPAVSLNPSPGVQAAQEAVQAP